MPGAVNLNAYSVGVEMHLVGIAGGFKSGRDIRCAIVVGLDGTGAAERGDRHHQKEMDSSEV